MIVKEHINFERGLDPKKSMNIGMEAQISNFMEKYSISESHWLSDLLQNEFKDKLEPDIRKAWIEHLLKNPETNSNLDENDYYVLKEMGISWVPYLPFVSDNFKYEKKGPDKYFISFSGWEDFVDIIELDRNTNKDFLISVLSGSAFEFFEYDRDSYEDLTDFIWIFEKIQSINGINLLNEIKNKALYFGANPDNMETIKDLITEISENQELSDIKDVMIRSVMESQELADESAAYYHMLEEIKKYYEIGEGEWINKGIDFFKAEITKAGIEKISYALVTGDNKLNYSPPYNGYSGSVTPEDIVEALEDKIEDLR